jgi:hypothetical protein
MVSRGDSSIIIQKIYTYFGEKPFTFHQISKKIPQVRPSFLMSMRNSNVVKLVNGKIRSVGRTKKNPSLWRFTAEALIVLQKQYG